MKSFHYEMVAQVAATLLSGRMDAEPHHVRQAIQTACLIIDEARSVEEKGDAAAAAAGDAKGAAAA